MVLKGCSYVGVPLWRLSIYSAFGGRAGLDVDISHVFLWGMLAAFTLVGGVGGDGGAGACAGCEVWLPFFSVAVVALWWESSAPKLLEWNPWEIGWSWLCSSLCFFLPCWVLFSKGGYSWSQRGCMLMKVWCPACAVCDSIQMQPLVMSFPLLWPPQI